MQTELVERAKRMMLLAPEGAMWNQQTEYPGEFPERKWRMTDEDVRAHLAGESWLASRLPAHGRTDRVVFDIDAKSEDDLDRRNRIYQDLRTFLGTERRLLIWGTPSGYGLRVACRIPETPMAQFAACDRTGLLPEALRAAGIEPGVGDLEIYPAAHRCDRQLFGRRMPFLYPSTLEPIPGADLGELFSEAKLNCALDLVEDWHEAIDREFAAMVAELPRLPLPRGAASAGPEPTLRRPRHRTPGEETVRLAREGLTAPRTRYRAEFELGTAMWLWPEIFAHLGLPSQPTREHVAVALAIWLSTLSNGHSDEWRESVRRYGREHAIHRWTERYTKLNQNDGMAPVDRMRRAALAFNPSALPTVHLSAAEREEILRVAKWARWSGDLTDSELYLFEVWASTWLRKFKGQIRQHNGGATAARAQAELKASWMAEWPGGKQYLRFRTILEKAGKVLKVRQYRPPSRTDVPGRAITYEIAQPDWITLGDLPLTVEQVHDGIAGISAYGRDSTVDQGYHALHLLERGIDPVRRYGRSTAKIVKRFQDALHPPSPFLR